jgi:hypothetical protein
MRTRSMIIRAAGGWLTGAVLAFTGGFSLRGQELDPNLGDSNSWQHIDWLAPSSTPGTNGQLTTTTAPAAKGDPFTIVGQGSAWQENVAVTYARALAPGVDLSYQSSATTLNESSNPNPAPTDGTPDDLSHGQKAALQFQPFPAVTLSGNVHAATDDAGSPQNAWETYGRGFNAEGHLPGNSVLSFSLNDDTTTTGSYPSSAPSTADAYDAQWQQPLGNYPLTAVLKGHYEETATDGATQTRAPSLEQSLVWKPADGATLQMGLRQQHYQDFPGITNQLNETLFADWAQSILPNVTWHSYAEVLTSDGTRNVAPAVITPAVSGANGTPQSADPTNSLGASFTDQTVTFATGPSFKLDRDLSANLEYSNKIDRNPAPGGVDQEQRFSVSLKGTF